jgi:membrane protein DedA with SNARE-associated domain
VGTTLTALITLFVVSLIPLAPTEPVLVGMGVLAASGRLSLPAVIITAAVACSMSDHLLYFFGRFAGARSLDKLHNRPSVMAANEWLTRHITKWGAPVLVVGRWLPAGGTIGALLTGTLRWKLARFTPASVIGSLLWSAYAALVGYFGGAITGQPVTGLLLSLGVAALLALVCSIVVQRVHHHRDNQQAPVSGQSQPLAH